MRFYLRASSIAGRMSFKDASILLDPLVHFFDRLACVLHRRHSWFRKEVYHCQDLGLDDAHLKSSLTATQAKVSCIETIACHA